MLQPLVFSLALFASALAEDAPPLPKGAAARFGTPVKVEIGKRIVEHDIQAVVFTDDGKSIAAGKRNGSLLIHEIATGKEVASIKGAHKSEIISIVRRDKKLLTASADGEIKEWDAAGKAIRTVTAGRPPLDHGAFQQREEARRRPLGEQSRLQILDVDSGRVVRKARGANVSHQLAFAPDDLSLLVAGGEVLQMWDLTKGTKLWQRGQELPRGEVVIDSMSHSGVAFSPDQKYAAATIDSQTGAYVLIWDAKTGKGHRRFPARSGHVHFVFSPDSKWLALGGSHPEVAVYSVETGKIAHDFEKPGERVLSIAFSPDGTRLATGAWDGTVTIWDMKPLIGDKPELFPK